MLRLPGRASNNLGPAGPQVDDPCALVPGCPGAGLLPPRSLRCHHSTLPSRCPRGSEPMLQCCDQMLLAGFDAPGFASIQQTCSSWRMSAACTPANSELLTGT